MESQNNEYRRIQFNKRIDASLEKKETELDMLKLELQLLKTGIFLNS